MLEHLICLQEASLKVCVDAHMGGHIIEFSLAGNNALTTRGPEIGSTFWPSPQQAWGWPPPRTLDKAPYRIYERQPRIELESSVCDITGLQLKKTFSLTAEQLLVEYTMYNPGSKPLTFAPWEISRIGGGLTFYQSAKPPLEVSTGEAISSDGYFWHVYQPHKQRQHEKIFANGSSGWLANVYDRLLLIKQFEPVPATDVAPGEAEIEIYAHSDVTQPYIEIEQQGRYRSIGPGDSRHWQVGWRLVQLPEGMLVQPGNKQLPQLVQRVLGISI